MPQYHEDVHITAAPPKDSTGLPERSTRRLRVDSWEKSNRQNGRAGDAIALHWMRPDAKAFIGWWDATDPDHPECKAWIGAHDEANNPEAAPHRHFSIEVTDSTGQMQTRLGIPYDQDHTNITTTSADFTVKKGTLRVPHNSALEFSVNDTGSKGSRWSMKMTQDENLELRHHQTRDSSAETFARFDASTGRIELSSIGVADIVTTDRATGARSRIYVENGRVCVEEI